LIDITGSTIMRQINIRIHRQRLADSML